MAKPDQPGGSLEDILSSIRKSLAEQSTDALADPAADTADSQAKPGQRRDGLVGRLANATVGLSPRPDEVPRSDDLSDVLETEASPRRPAVDAPPAPAVAVEPPPAAAAARPEAPAPRPDNDPLWFLTRSAEPAPSVAPHSAAAAAEPVLTRPEVVRASLPPFFGATPETAPVEIAPRPDSVAAARSLFNTASPARMADPALAREVSLVAEAAETAARPSGPSAANGAGGGPQAPQASHALEAMVLELLKPMLRQWLDQNMPRLVAEALKAEADRTSASETSPKMS